MALKKLAATTAALVAGALALSACGGSANSGSEGSGAAHGSEITVGFLTPVQRNDGGITELQLSGIDAALKENPSIKLTSVVDKVADPEKQIRTLRTLAENNNLVIAGSAVLNQAVDTVADEFPDTRFISFAAPTKNFHKNVTSVVAQPGLSAVLAGAVMAERTKSGKIGAVGGKEVPQNAAWGNGIAQGAAQVSQAVKASSTVTGDYNDVGKAKQAVGALISDGVDQVVGALDSGIQGIYQAAEASTTPIEVYQVFKLNCSASKTVVGAGIVNWSALIKSAVLDFAGNNLKAGVTLYGVKDPDIQRFEFCPGKSTPELEDTVEKVRAALASGELAPAAGVGEADPGYAVDKK